MIRIGMVMLCLILAAAAAGRYQAEVEVRETKREIQRLERAKAVEASEIQLLRAEIAYLESPERLAKIAGKVTELQPLAGNQILTADDFAVAFGKAGSVKEETLAKEEGDVILHAIAMADLGQTK